MDLCARLATAARTNVASVPRINRWVRNSPSSDTSLVLFEAEESSVICGGDLSTLASIQLLD